MIRPVLIAAVVGFLLAEGTVRLAMPRIDLLGLVGQRPTLVYNTTQVTDAYCGWAWPRGAAITERKITNSHGFIHTPELPVKKPAGTIRIAFIGGSSTMGLRLWAHETWPRRTVDRLRERFPNQRFDFINAAHGGYGTFESYGRFWSRIRFFTPDIVVVYHAWNDMYYFREPDLSKWRMTEDPDGNWTAAKSVQAAGYEPLWVDSLIEGSQLLARFRVALTKPITGEAVNISWYRDWRRITDDYNPAALEAYRGNLQLFKAAADLIGAEFFVAKQATLIVPGASARVMHPAYIKRHGFSLRGHVKAYQDIYRVIEEDFPADRIIHTEILSGDTRVLRDHVHLKPYGADQVATIMAQALGDYLQESGRPSG